MKVATEAEVAWAAGLFEGEGCITFGKRDARAVARINMVDEEPLRRFAEIVVLGRFYGPYQQKQPNRSPYFAWSAAKAEAFLVMDLLAPWLSRRRLARLAEVRELAEIARPAGPSGWERQRRAARARIELAVG